MSAPTEILAVPALDLKAQYRTIREEIDRAVRGVVESQYFILGPEVAQFEAEAAEYCGSPTPSAAPRAPTPCCCR